jgi:hypothetical protein
MTIRVFRSTLVGNEATEPPAPAAVPPLPVEVVEPRSAAQAPMIGGRPAEDFEVQVIERARAHQRERELVLVAMPIAKT